MKINVYQWQMGQWKLLWTMDGKVVEELEVEGKIRIEVVKTKNLKGVVIWSNSIPTLLELAMAECLKGGK